MDRLDRHITLFFVALSLLLGVCDTVCGQTSVSGVINSYARVTSMGTDNVTVDASDLSKFSQGDTVLLMQMKAISIDVGNTLNYGSAITASPRIGKHEFFVIESIDNVNNIIVFASEIINSTFDVTYGVQLIRVPSYESAVIPDGGVLTAEDWDMTSMTGGVLALFAGKSLALYGDIDVTGKGFRGGRETIGIGNYVGSNAYGNNSYNELFDKYSYAEDGDTAGYKGEGLAAYSSGGVWLYPLFSKGKGANFSGGGGGFGGFSGGGGGANYGAGGIGGREIYYQDVANAGGIGGRRMDYLQGIGGLYLGGGGGGSIYRNGEGIASSGANGGGIVIIVCDSIYGNGSYIRADGGTPPVQASGYGSGGGGGGGGSVAIYTRVFDDLSVSVSAKGGSGGSRSEINGNGGGGGGGYITLSNITIDSAFVGGGASGTTPVPSTVGRGDQGRTDSSFEPLFNGFLFNTIWSEVSGNQVDSICSNVVPKTILGTIPTQDNPIYVWQKTYNLAEAATVIAGATNKDYSPTATESATHWIRRIVKDDDLSPTITDTSKWVQIIVQPAIQGNIVGDDDRICYGQTPATIIPSNSGPSEGNGLYEYKWVQTNDDLDWSNASDAIGTDIYSASFIPPALTDTTYYKRVVTSGRCVDYSNTVKMTVLTSISNNTASLTSGATDTTICINSTPNIIKGSVFPILSGGLMATDSYAFEWSYSTDGGDTFTPIPSAVGADYSPSSLTQTTSFRRRVISGECSGESNVVTVTVLSDIENNVITSGNQTVCYNTIPNTLMGSMFTGADTNVFTWRWQQSVDGAASWEDAYGTNDEQNYTPPALTSATMYRRIVSSGEHGCCTDTSSYITVSLYDLPTVAITNTADTSVCDGQPIEIKILLTGQPNWEVVLQGEGEDVTIEDITTTNYTISRTPQATSGMSTFNYSVANVVDGNGCVATSLLGDKTTSIFRNPISNAGRDDEVCGPEYLLNASPSDGEGIWVFPTQVVAYDSQTASSTGVVIDSSFTSASVTYSFVWRETNWQCFDADTIDITFYNRPDDVNAGGDTSVMTFDNVIRIEASPLESFESGEWTVIEGSGNFQNSSENVTEVRNVSIGTNQYRWSVVNGSCLVYDDLVVEVYDVVVPEGLSPNGDAINDEMTISGLELESQEAELVIVNTAGARVYSTSNKNGQTWQEWNGTNTKGDLVPEGTYYYILKVQSLRTGVEVSKSGFIIVKRK